MKSSFSIMLTRVFIMTPQAPPNFLRAAALAEYKKPVVVMPGEEHHEEEDVEPQPEFRDQQQTAQVQLHTHEKVKYFSLCSRDWHRFFPSWQYYMFNQMGAPDVPVEHRETDNESLKRELEVLKPELQLIKSEVSA